MRFVRIIRIVDTRHNIAIGVAAGIFGIEERVLGIYVIDAITTLRSSTLWIIRRATIKIVLNFTVIIRRCTTGIIIRSTSKIGFTIMIVIDSITA